MVTLRLSSSVLVLLLTACAVGPDFTHPKPETPETFHEAAEHTEGEKPEVWWQALDDAQLAQLMEAVEKDNPTLEQARARIAQAEALVRVERGGFLPQLNASGAWTRGDSGTFGGAGAGAGFGVSGLNTSKSIGANASWELDIFGGVRRAYEAATARLDASSQQAEATRLSLQSSLVDTWYGLKACEVDATQLREDLQSRGTVAEVTKLKADAGFAPPADIGLADASAADASAALELRRSQCQQMRHALTALTGLSPQALAELLPADADVENAILPLPPSYTLGVPAEVIAARPDVKALEASLEAANADIGVATAQRYPTVSVVGSLGRQWIESGGSTIDFNTWSLGPQLTLPIFAGGALAAQVDAREAAYREALGTLREGVRGAVQEVEDALSRVKAAESREASLSVSVAGYDRRFIATEALYKAGSGSLLDVETVRRNLILSKQAYTSAKLERLQAWSALMAATGGQSAVNAQKPEQETEEENPTPEVVEP